MTASCTVSIVIYGYELQVIIKYLGSKLSSMCQWKGAQNLKFQYGDFTVCHVMYNHEMPSGLTLKIYF